MKTDYEVKLVKKEGQFDKVEIKMTLSLGKWGTLLDALKSHGTTLALEMLALLSNSADKNDVPR